MKIVKNKIVKVGKCILRKYHKQYKVLTLLLLLTSVISAQTPEWVWAQSTGCSFDQGYGDMETDLQGNTHLTGYFSSPITIGSHTLYNSDTTNGSFDVFVAKYDSVGNVLWVRQIGGTGSEMSDAISVDNSGNVYVGGSYKSDSLFFANDTLVNDFPNYDNALMLKLDANGNELWAKGAGTNYSDFVYSSTTDQNGNVYFSGGFHNSTITFGNTTLQNPYLYSNRMFLVKYDTNGNFLWARTAEGTSAVWANAIDSDPFGNIYVGGYFSNSQLIIGADTMYTEGWGDIFLAKYDSIGSPIWGRRIGSDQWDICYSITTDKFGDVCFVGNFSSDSIVLGADTLFKNGVYNMVVAKFDTNGYPVWAKNATGTGNAVSANTVTADSLGNFYVGGNYYWPRLIIGNDTLLNYDTLHHNNTFTAKYSSGGTESWAISTGGSDNDGIYSIGVDLNNNVYVAGLFASPSIYFDSIVVFNNPNCLNIFVAKLKEIYVNVGVNNTETDFNSRIYPNPFNLSATIEIDSEINNGELNIYNSYGQKVKSLISLSGNSITILRERLDPGIYFYVLSQNKKIFSKGKFIIVN